MQKFQLGTLLPTGTATWGPGEGPRDVVALATTAEELGYDSLWANDTLRNPRIEPLTMLAAVAPATRRVTLGTAALLPALRTPVPAAQAIAALDLLAEGRLTLAVGAGYPEFSEPDYAAAGVPWARRFDRLDDTVALWRQLWTATEPSSFEGQVLRFDDLPVGTAPHRKGGPPIWLAGATPAALNRTGRMYDGWLPYPPDPAVYAAGLATVRAAAGDAARDPAAVTPALFTTVHIAKDVASGRDAVDAFCRANYGLPLEAVEQIQTVVTGPVEHVAERLATYVEAGARHLVVRIAARDVAGHVDQLERLKDTARLAGA